MNKPFLRVVKLNKLPPEINNLFPGIKVDRKLYDMGEYTPLYFFRNGNKLVPFQFDYVNHPELQPEVILYRVGNGIYTEDEVEFVTKREVELENLLFDLQLVFPNNMPSDILGENAGPGDEEIVDIVVPEVRKLLRETPRHRYAKNYRRLAGKRIKRIRKENELFNSKDAIIDIFTCFLGYADNK